MREVYLTEELEQKIRQNAQNGDAAFWDKLQQTGYETVSTEVLPNGGYPDPPGHSDSAGTTGL